MASIFRQQTKSSAAQSEAGNPEGNADAEMGSPSKETKTPVAAPKVSI